MKHQHLKIIVAGVATIGLLTACNKGPSSGFGKKTVSAEPNSFAEVTSQLDPGGNLYIYISTEQFLKGLSDKVAQVRQVVESLPNIPDQTRGKLGRGLDVVTNIIHDSGVEDISGFGMSSLAVEKHFYRTKSFLHHYKGQGNGFLWSLFGQKPHALAGLDLLPAHTAFAVFSDLDVPLLWSTVQQEATQSGFPQAEQLLARWPELFEQSTDLKWDQVLASLGGEYGVVLTLDESRMISVPLPGGSGPLEVPEPALMLVAKVSNDAIFNRLEQAMNRLGQSIQTNDSGGVKMRTVPLPLPLPIQLRPTLATSQGYLFIASTDAVIKDALAVKSTDEFKRLAANVPEQGNQFSFLSQRLGQVLLRVQRQAMEMAPGGARVEMLRSMLSSTNAAFGFSVSANTDQGWLSVANGNVPAAKALMAAAVVPVAVGAAVALPAIAKARRAAHQN
jgi:hypothetical protein